MQRISLRNRPAGPTGMTLAQAVEIFMSADDLAFDIPVDPTLPPIQNFSENTTKRQSEGQFSWMATLTPLQDTLIDGATLARNTDLYLLSIVVFHRRDMSMTMQYTDAAYNPSRSTVRTTNDWSRSHNRSTAPDSAAAKSSCRRAPDAQGRPDRPQRRLVDVVGQGSGAVQPDPLFPLVSRGLGGRRNRRR
jgi:hypothetical protein